MLKKTQTFVLNIILCKKNSIYKVNFLNIFLRLKLHHKKLKYYVTIVVNLYKTLYLTTEGEK